jgi:hypothetical protein
MEMRSGTVNLPDEDFDTGRATAPGEYSLADETSAELLDKLANGSFTNILPELTANVLFTQPPARSPWVKEATRAMGEDTTGTRSVEKHCRRE